MTLAALLIALLSSSGCKPTSNTAKDPQQSTTSQQPSDTKASTSAKPVPPSSQPSISELEQRYFQALERGEWFEAEKRSRQMIVIDPDNPIGPRYLARLLSSQGRRQEASAQVQKLVKRGSADARELLSLIDQRGPFQLVSFDRWTQGKGPGMFALGQAKQSYVGEKDRKKTMRWIEQCRENLNDDVPPDARASLVAFHARVLAETNQSDAFVDLLSSEFSFTHAELESHSDHWVALGTWLQFHDRDPESVYALTRALEIDPTERTAMRLLLAALTRMKQGERAATVQSSLSKLDAIFRKCTTPDPTAMFEIATSLESLLRPWEAIRWYQLSSQGMGFSSQENSKLHKRVEALGTWASSADPNQLIAARTKKMLGFVSSDYPPIDSDTIVSTVKQTGETDTANANATPLLLRDIATESGIQSTFVSGFNLQKIDFFLHQANGGGLGLLDYDRDGQLDVYVAQSGGDPNQLDSSQPNELYRQTQSRQFVAVQSESQCDSRRFGQGVCAADVNQDGFVDLVLANIGQNQVLLNQGDGTFRDATTSHLPQRSDWTSSIAAADLNTDGLPDLITVNYIDDPEVFRRKCVGKVIACKPQDFQAGRDHFLSCKPDGTFREPLHESEEIIAGEVQPNYGFGVMVGDFDGQGGNEVFVGNDGDLNHFYSAARLPDGSLAASSLLMESAGIKGVAVGSAGVAEACMGVAAGDYDRDGRLDLVVANFHQEPLNLFLQPRPGTFVDDAMRRGLDLPSRSMLGFGCQSPDLDNDGWQDLVVLNGHLYDYRDEGIPFHMKPQLFRGGEKGFDLQLSDDPSSYFSDSRLGRTLAQGDLDGDGRVDLVANHLDAPIAVLRNETEAGNWLSVNLVGTVSERNAVGAVVTVRSGDQSWTGWRVGGDGYMATNDSAVHFGLGPVTQVDKLEVRWPSGAVTRRLDVEVNQRVLVVEELAQRH